MSALFVQPDGTIIVDSFHPDYLSLRPQLAAFADLFSQADRFHVFRISALTLWQAAASGWTSQQVLESLRSFSTAPLPYEFQTHIVEHLNRWGKIHLDLAEDGQFLLTAAGLHLPTVANHAKLRKLSTSRTAKAWCFPLSARAEVKQKLTSAGFPCLDRIGYQESTALAIRLRPEAELRDYQKTAVERFMKPGHGQSAVVVLPCGAGKTMVGIACISELQVSTLILTPTESSAMQWIRELRRWTDVQRSDLSVYGPTRQLTPITVSTYQRVTAKTRQGAMPHLNRLAAHAFGFVIYDEVHMLPAPLFRLAAEMQSIRRLGLTATLIREDGAQTDVFSLIGPKCYEAEWKQLEQRGYLAHIRYLQVRVPLTTEAEYLYTRAGPRERHRIAALNAKKLQVMEHLVERHPNQSILIIGHYLADLGEAARRLNCPVITGETPIAKREYWLQQFRSQAIRRLVLSRIANMAIDLPAASIAIQLSGLYGSRQEEAQRFGRLLRPDFGPATFYSLVSLGTVEEEMSHHRSLYLTGQGYTFEVADWSESRASSGIVEVAPTPHHTGERLS